MEKRKIELQYVGEQKGEMETILDNIGELIEDFISSRILTLILLMGLFCICIHITANFIAYN